MRRSIDICRSLLLAIETPTVPATSIGALTTVGHHLQWMEEYGLIESIDSSRSISEKFKRPAEDYRLTWKGYEDLDMIRDSEVWVEILQQVQTHGELPWKYVTNTAFQIRLNKIAESNHPSGVRWANI